MPINIDGSGVSGVTIDGNAVREITMDGTIVWPEKQSTEFTYTGSQQKWTVPSGVNFVEVELYGAGGNIDGVGTNHFTGTTINGGYVEATLSVDPDDTLYLYIGGKGAAGSYGGGGSGGWNGGGDGAYHQIDDFTYDGPYTITASGGGGGGATDVRLNGTSISDRVVAAGGGAGTSARGAYTPDGENKADGVAGRGGATNGESGESVTAGTISASGGSGGDQNFQNTSDYEGANGNLDWDWNSSTESVAIAACGGGGAGYVGGDSGQASIDLDEGSTAAAGSGGGSNYVGGVYNVHNNERETGSSGDGKIVIKYPTQ